MKNILELVGKYFKTNILKVLRNLMKMMDTMSEEIRSTN